MLSWTIPEKKSRRKSRVRISLSNMARTHYVVLFWRLTFGKNSATNHRTSSA
jgi:hypothetical protein